MVFETIASAIPPLRLLDVVNWSGRRDSNAGPLEPHSSALPGCATPRQVLWLSVTTAALDYHESPALSNLMIGDRGWGSGVGSMICLKRQSMFFNHEEHEEQIF